VIGSYTVGTLSRFTSVRPACGAARSSRTSPPGAGGGRARCGSRASDRLGSPTGCGSIGCPPPARRSGQCSRTSHPAARSRNGFAPRKWTIVTNDKDQSKPAFKAQKTGSRSRMNLFTPRAAWRGVLGPLTDLASWPGSKPAYLQRVRQALSLSGLILDVSRNSCTPTMHAPREEHAVVGQGFGPDALDVIEMKHSFTAPCRRPPAIKRRRFQVSPRRGR